MSAPTAILTAEDARALTRATQSKPQPIQELSESLLASLSHEWNEEIRRKANVGGLSEAYLQTPFKTMNAVASIAVANHFLNLGYKYRFETDNSRHGREYDRFAVIVSW